MIIDFHVYVGKSLLGYSLMPDELLRNMDIHGIDAAVTCPVKGLDPYFLEPNRAVADLQRAHPGRLHGFARVNPHLGKEAEAALVLALDGHGLKGLVLHPWEETFAVNDPKVFPLVEATLRRGLPVMLETGYPILSHPLQAADLAKRFGSADPASWREPRRMYAVTAQGTAKPPPLKFYDRGTWSQAVALGP